MGCWRCLRSLTLTLTISPLILIFSPRKKPLQSSLLDHSCPTNEYVASNFVAKTISNIKAIAHILITRLLELVRDNSNIAKVNCLANLPFSYLFSYICSVNNFWVHILVLHQKIIIIIIENPTTLNRFYPLQTIHYG